MKPNPEFKVGDRIYSFSLKDLNPGVIIAVNNTKITMQWLGAKSTLKGDCDITYNYDQLREAFEEGQLRFVIEPNRIWKELNE